MKFACAAAALSLMAAAPALAAPTLYGPTPYLSAADSPFNPANYGHFYLEDFEDGLMNTPGLSAQGNGICVSNVPGCFFPNTLADSVGNGGNPTVGKSLFANGPITITFDETVLGGLPTAAGLVWTDGNNDITFQAFDGNNVLLGTIVGHHADGNFSGGTAEDRFYGLTYAGGIKKLTVSNPPGIELDHIQYGLGTAVDGGSVPEPASWALMIMGFGVAGSLLRRERSAAKLA